MKYVRLDARSVYKRFYTQLLPHVAKLTEGIEGIPSVQDRCDYAYLLIQRLVFLYFLQQKGLLYRDRNFLQNSMCRVQAYQKNRFYRDFLRPLFENVAHISFTNPALFPCKIQLFLQPLSSPHELEQNYPTVDIPAECFTQLFTFLNGYQWQLAERTPQTLAELSPALLGYLFEQRVNQKQMGAYYTSEDVTSYSVRNTVVPAFFRCLADQVPHMFSANAALWQLLRTAPDRYIPVSLRTSAYLPKESEQEYSQRHQRYEKLRTAISSGNIVAIDALITHNLLLEQLALDLFACCQAPEMLYLCYLTLHQLRILDPTCGTGAYLLAALHLLTKLYKACLLQLQARIMNGENVASRSAKDLLCSIDASPSLDYFVIARILTHNLYGMDVMPEAVTICQQRLLLSLFAALPTFTLPIDATTQTASDPRFIARDQSGDTDSICVSANKLACGRATSGPYDGNGTWRAIRQGDVLAGGLHRFAVKGFDVVIGNPPYVECSKYRCAGEDEDFFVVDDYTNTYSNIYAAIVKKSLECCRSQSGYLALLVPVSLCTSERFTWLRQIVMQQASHCWIANFEIFPSRLFDGAFQRLSLLLAHRASPVSSPVSSSRLYEKLYVTKPQRWYSAEREQLFALMAYTYVQQQLRPGVFPKLAGPLHERILQKVYQRAQGAHIADALCPGPTSSSVYYQEATNYWLKATRRVPHHCKNGRVMTPAHGRFLFCHDDDTADALMALLNSSLFYLWFVTYSDGFHLSHSLVKAFPVVEDLYHLPQLLRLAQALERDIQQNTLRSTRNTKKGDRIEIEEYRMVLSKPLLDQIDTVLAEVYDFDEAELDFVLNYESKYRMGHHPCSKLTLSQPRPQGSPGAET